MNVLVAPQGFKGTLSGKEAANCIAEGVLRAKPDAKVTLLPIADGGHGTLDALLNACGGERRTTQVVGPVGNPVLADWGMLSSGTAVVEMAQASGLTLTSEDERDPMNSTTYGTGQLLTSALDAGCSRIIVGLGGSATSDGGSGAAEALGIKLHNAQGNLIPRGAVGLLELEGIDVSGRHQRILETEILIASDVSNPLLGPEGAAITYGPQKGANPEQVATIERSLAHLANIISRESGLRLEDVPGMGAAGGLAAGLVGLVGATLVPGSKILADSIGLRSAIQNSDVVITGEGRVDRQTLYEKAPLEVLSQATILTKPVILIGGSVDLDTQIHLSSRVSIIEACLSPGMAAPGTQSVARNGLVYASERAFRRWLAQS